MEQLIEAFGVDIRLIIIQIINFVVLLGILSYFLYKPLLNLLEEREGKIAKGIKDAEDAAEAKSQADTEKQAILKDAHNEAEQVAVRAKQYADEKAATIVDGANQKAEGIVKDAERKGEELKAQAKKESEAEVAKLAVLAAEKILRK